MIRIIEKEGKLYLGVINPSLNDYMVNTLKENTIERNQIIDNSLYVEQLERILKDGAQEKILDELNIGELLNRKCMDNKILFYYLYDFWINRNLKEQHKDLIIQAIIKMPRSIKIFNKNIEKAAVFSLLLYTPRFKEFYKIKEKLTDFDFRRRILLNLKADEAAELLYILKEQELEECYYEEWEDQFLDILCDFISEQDLVDLLEYENIDDLEYYYENKDKDNYKSELSRINLKITDSLEEKAFDLIEITGFIDINKQATIDLVCIAVKEKIDEELQDSIESYLNLDSEKGYPYLSLINKTAHIEELDLILNRKLY